jgi:uncharacterized protein (TIGR03435 family)
MRDSLMVSALLCLAAAAQVANPHAPAFDVASVKPAADPGMAPEMSRKLTSMICLVPCSPGERLTIEGARVEIRYVSLSRLVLTAYRLKPYQLSGPDWMKTQRFDILAKIPDGGSKHQVPEMLQSLLAERFKLAFHRENKDQPVYALVVSKNGQKLQPPAADADAPLPNTPGGRGLYTPGGEGSVDANGNFATTGGALGPMRGGRGPNGMKMDMLKITMSGLAELLTPHEDRPVVDITNLKGAYRFTFEIAPPASVGDGGRKGGPPADGAGERDGRGGPGADAPPDVFGEALFRALEKAGLKLEKTNAPVETIIVDHLEKRPTEN